MATFSVNFTNFMHQAKSFNHRLLLCGLVLPLLVCTFSCKGPVEEEKTGDPDKVRVRTANYSKVDYDLTMSFSGDVKAWKKVNLSFNVPGKIDRFYFDEGETVKKGALLASLEQDDYQAIRDQSFARWEKAKRDYERSRRLWEKESIREQVVQDAETAFKAAEAVLEAADLNLKHCHIKAPFNGHVAHRFNEEKEMVSPGQVVFTVMDLSRVIIEVGITEKSIGRIKEDQKASLVFEAIPGKEFSGRVTQVAVSSLPNTHLYKVEITVQNPDLVIKPGMTATSTIIIEKIKDVYVLSLDVSVMRDGERVIFIAEDGQAKRVMLKDYIISGDKMIIRDSLPEKGQVITSGQGALFEGMMIMIIEEE